MASSNVDYYKRQKELQDILHINEEKRTHLNQQLRTYWKSDERLAKLRVAKLQCYWKKICEDEKHSKHRNEQILKHFDRIEAHLSKVTARTEKLRVLKEQYVDYIEQTYPRWVEQVLQWRQQKEAAEQSSQQPPVSHGHVPHVSLQPPLPEQIYQNLEPRSSPQTQITRQYYMDQPTDDRVHPQNIDTQLAGSETYLPEERAPPQPFDDNDDDVQEYQSHMYQDDDIYLEPIQRQYPDGQSHTDLMPDKDDGQDISEQVSSINLTGPIDELLSRPVQSVRVERISHTGERIPEPTPQPQMMVSPDEETDSEFGDIDLPSVSGRQAPTPARQEERESAMFNKQASVSNSPIPEIASPDLQPPHHASVQRRSSSPIKPELTAEGLGILLKYVENDIPDALALEGYYRSPRPSSGKRMDIINKANNGEALGMIDAELVSMVILEQMTLVVRSLKASCLLPDILWSRDTSQMGFVEFRSHLSSDAQPLWDVLFDHFTVLVKNNVMETNQVAAVFIPCLVEEDTMNRGTAFTLLVRLLDSTCEDDMMGGSPRDTMDSQMNTARSSQTGGIPPLKFGSLLDRPFSDDESTTFFDQSVPSGPKVPANETAAYQNLLSGTRTCPPQYQQPEEDTDDEMEKQFASVLSPRDSDRFPATNIPSKPADLHSESPSPLASPVYVPTAIETRSSSAAAAAASTNKPAVIMPSTGYKISSDSDTEMDIQLPGQRVENEQEDDYLEFYS